MKKIYYNGTILTMEAYGVYVQALATEDGTIVKTGSPEELQTLYPDAELVDLQGNTLMPGFICGHGHISMAVQMAQKKELGHCTGFTQIVDEMKSYIRENGYTKDDIAVGYNFDHNAMPGYAHLDKTVLNQVSESMPVVVYNSSFHIAYANDMALALGGVTAETLDPMGGKFGHDAQTGEPNGYLEETALMAAHAVTEQRTKYDPDLSLQKAQELYFSYGVTTAQDGAVSESDITLLRNAAADGKLKIDVVAYPMVGNGAKELCAQNPDCVEKYVNHYKIGGYKMFLDGSPQGKSAWLTKPYENSGEYAGYPRITDEDAEAYCKEALTAGKQLLTHCNGDAAGDQLLKYYEKAYLQAPEGKKDNLRPVMIHCQTVREDQLDKMVELQMIPSIFVGHVFYWGDTHLRNLGQARAERISPVRSALKRGLIYNFHQDTPVTPPDMLHSVWCAVNRVTRDGVVLGKQQAVSIFEALNGVTIHTAYQYFEEAQKGTLQEGKTADMIILDQNPLAVEPMALKDIKVLETIKDGVTVYTRS